MKKKFYVKFIMLIISTAIVVACFIPLFNSISYGLDLQGGFEVLYQVSPLEEGKLTSDMLKSTYKTIGRRIDVLGVSEPVIIVEGNSRIRVKLAGVKDQDTARDILSKTASLTFRNSSDELLMTSEVLKGTNLDQDPKTGAPVVALSIKDSDKFYKVTKNISKSEDQLIVIWLDFKDGEDSFIKEKDKCGSLSSSRCLSAATVTQGFAGNVIIQGKFTKEEAESLSELINSGSIPTKLTEISSKTVGASFGENSLNKTLIAGITGISFVMLFMIYIYGFVGFISAIGIILYTFLTFLIFYSIGGVLTLPGIAALVLGIGMAVDANVINFESIREELSKGSSLKVAFTESYKRSIVTIIDANVTTLIAAIVMFVFGESAIKGFATMLIINIIITVVVMVYLIKYILKIFIKTDYFNDKKEKFIIIRKKLEKRKDNIKVIDFLKLRKWATYLSLFIIVSGMIFIITKGLNLGIDYKGGSDITIVTEKKLDLSKIKSDIESLKYNISDIDNIDDFSIYVKIDNVLDKNGIAEVTNYFKTKYDAKTEIGVISDIVKKELTKNAIISVLLSFIGIIIYVSLRFKFSTAVSAVVALVHDVLIVVAVFAIFRIELNVIFIAAILTIIGYSINDTIVIFDRIRENIINKKNGTVKNKEELYDSINLSITQTMTRTLYTAFTTIIVVIGLIFLGSYEIINFNIALLIGLISGTYSTVFIASALWYEIEKNDINKVKTKKIKKDELDEVIVKGINA